MKPSTTVRLSRDLISATIVALLAIVLSPGLSLGPITSIVEAKCFPNCPTNPNKVLDGSYGFRLAGHLTVDFEHTRAVVGRITFNGGGGIGDGSWVQSDSGFVNRFSVVAGSYTLNSKGTGTVELTITTGFEEEFVTEILDIVVVAGGNEIQMLLTGGRRQGDTFAPDAVLSGVAVRQ